jgi:hypothetical protein
MSFRDEDIQAARQWLEQVGYAQFNDQQALVPSLGGLAQCIRADGRLAQEPALALLDELQALRDENARLAAENGQQPPGADPRGRHYASYVLDDGSEACPQVLAEVHVVPLNNDNGNEPDEDYALEVWVNQPVSRFFSVVVRKDEARHLVAFRNGPYAETTWLCATRVYDVLRLFTACATGHLPPEGGPLA